MLLLSRELTVVGSFGGIHIPQTGSHQELQGVPQLLASTKHNFGLSEFVKVYR